MVVGSVVGISIDRAATVSAIEEPLEALGVMHVGGGDVIASDELVFGIDGNVVLVTVIVLAVLLRPACLDILLDFLGRCFSQSAGIKPSLIVAFRSACNVWIGIAIYFR